jgi:hypothetical protein
MFLMHKKVSERLISDFLSRHRVLEEGLLLRGSTGSAEADL